MALVGCGVMGTRHAAVIAADPGCELVTVDVLPDRSAALASRFGGRAADRIPDRVDVAVIATPTTTHAEIAVPLLARGVWCLVEKPLADSLGAALRLGHPRCAVGHVERFNRAVRAAGDLAPRWIDARRIAPPSGRSLDVDVVLDLMIHDLDLVLGWAGPGAEVGWIEAQGTPDTAIVRLRTTCGLSASLVASRAADRSQRLIRCDGARGSAVLDLLAGRAWRDGVEVHDRSPGDALTRQWEQFVGAVRGGELLPDSGIVPPTSSVQGIRAVALAERIRAALRVRFEAVAQSAEVP